MRIHGPTWLILAIAAIALLSTAGQIMGFYADWLWFHEVQFTSVFVTVLQTKVLLGLLTGAVFFAILYGNVALAWRLAPDEVLMVVDDALGLPPPEIVEPYLRRLAFPVSATLALLASWLGADRWELILKALHPTLFGLRDPLFERDVAFYVFQLPLWNSLYSWLMTVLVVSGLAVIAVYFSTRGIQVSPGGISIVPRARGHLLILAALVLLLKAAGYRLAMFDSSSPIEGLPSAPAMRTSTPSCRFSRPWWSWRVSSPSCAWSRFVSGAGASSYGTSPDWSPSRSSGALPTPV